LTPNGSEGEVRIDITDNGMGMTPEVKARIFENFFTTKPAGQGTGLGMGITYDIITKNHNGQLLIESEPQVGSTFTFIIPVKIVK
jgi:signal transduction histidine kinase